MWLYPYNMKSLACQLGVDYRDLEELCNKKQNITTPVLQTIKYPFLKSIAACGMKRLYSDIAIEGLRLKYSKQHGKLHECLGISRETLKIVQDKRINIAGVDLIASLGGTVSYDIYLWYATHRNIIEYLTIPLNFLNHTDICRYVAEQVIVKHPMTNQNSSPYRDPYEETAQFWRDYLQMASNLEYDFNIKTDIMPIDLKYSHDVVSELTKVKYDSNADKAIQSLYPSLNQLYFYKTDTFTIRPPKDFKEFLLEGATLRHCVATMGYYKQHIKQTSHILFIRKNEEADVPFFTIEYSLKTQKIVQIHGRDHAAPDEKVLQFVFMWTSQMNQKETMQLAA